MDEVKSTWNEKKGRKGIIFSDSNKMKKVVGNLEHLHLEVTI